MRGVKKLTGAVAIMAQVQTIGKALGELLKLLEKEGSQITGDQFEKVFGFVRSTTTTIEAQARKDRIVISAGEFSWDTPVEPAQQPPAPRAPIASAPVSKPPAIAAEAPKPDWKKPTGRIAKSSPNLELAGQTTHIEIKTTPLKGEELDNAAGITLLSE